MVLAILFNDNCSVTDGWRFDDHDFGSNRKYFNWSTDYRKSGWSFIRRWLLFFARDFLSCIKN